MGGYGSTGLPVSKTFYLIGGNGAPNFGDELIADAWIELLSERHPDAKIIVDCNSTTTPVSFFSRYPANLRFIDGLKRLSNGVIRSMFCSGGEPGEEQFAASLAYGLDFFDKGHYKQFPQIIELVSTLETADSLHIFGGGYINTWKAPFSAFLLGVASAIRRAFGVRVFGTGLGVTPLELEDPAVIRSLRRTLADFELFECRDGAGHGRLSELCGPSHSLVKGLDDSYLRAAQPATPLDGKRRLHLSFIRMNLGPRLAGIYQEAIAMAAEFDEVCYWHCAPRLPDPNMERFAAVIPGMRILTCQSLVFDPIPAAPGDFMIAQRFHPHLIGARLGCDGAFVVSSPYYADKHGSVTALGSPFEEYKGGSIVRSRTRGSSAIMARETEMVAFKRELAAQCYG